MRVSFLGLVLALAAFAPACGGEGDGDKPAPGAVSGSGQTTSVEISAAEGGEVTIGDASLEIPGGALADDTTITVETAAPSSSLPDSASLKGLVYDFGPDGTEFTTAATLTLPSVGDPGEGKVAVIAWLDEEAGAWQDLATTVASDGSLSAEITHFTKFVVRLNDAVTSDCSFSKCGGDITGTWGLTGICADVPEGADPFGGACPEATVDVNLNVTGSITFEAGGTYTKNFETSSSVTFIVPASCLSSMGSSSCSDLEDERTACSGDPSDTCTCVQEEAPHADTGTGTWETTDSGELTMTEDGDEPESMTYCVRDGQVSVQQVNEEGVTITWKATAQ